MTTIFVREVKDDMDNEKSVMPFRDPAKPDNTQFMNEEVMLVSHGILALLYGRNVRLPRADLLNALDVARAVVRSGKNGQDSPSSD
jgi:hypothetical protein